MKALKLLTPGKIGGVELKNRIIVSSMCLNFSGKDGEVTDKMIAFFESRAKSGTGAFVIPANPHGENKHARSSLNADSRIGQWKPLLDAIHMHGAKAFCQIHPPGIQLGREGFSTSPFDLSTEQVQQLIESYARGAQRAQKAGFDGVEIHGAHAHEVALLLSQLLNTRTDQYGGNLENCARMAAEMVARMKELCGPDFPVIMRISAEERIPGGRELPESLKICQILQAAGADAIHVSAGMPASDEWECPPSEIRQGHLDFMGRYMKAGLDIPVILVGRVVEWQVAEKILENGDADFVAMARTALAASDWAAGVGRDDYPLRRCIGCNQGCRTRREQTKSVCFCLQNPLLGREELISISTDAVGKKVCVVGGGVAGLEAANIFSQRGCQVTIFEREKKLGGMFHWASMPPGKAPYRNVIEYYERVLPPRGVNIVTGVAVDGTPKGDWDLVVAAVGGEAICPPIIVENTSLTPAVDFLAAEHVPEGDYVVIGDGLVGYEVADYLLQQGKKTILVGNDPRDPALTHGAARWHFMQERFKKTGLEIFRHSTVKRINSNGFTVQGEDGVEREINGRYAYILACGYRPTAQSVTDNFAGKGAPVLVVGNASHAGDAMDAIHDAFCKSVEYTFACE